MNKFLLMLLVMTVTGCSDYREPDDFAEFVEFKALDMAGDQVDCAALTSTVIKKAVPSRYLSGSDEYTDDVLDFMFEDKYEFKSCGAELRSKKLEYCHVNLNNMVESVKDDYKLPSQFHYFCDELLVEAVQSIDDRYQLPNENNKFIVLESLNVMLDPATVTKITFKKDWVHLWSVTLHTADKKEYTAYYGSVGLWNNAKADFAAAATNTKGVADEK